MALSIKDKETDELARRLASATGETLTEAVKRALEERLERERHALLGTGLALRLVEIGLRCASQMNEPFHSSDHGDLLYDESGLPR
jgi:antitoxin VapB